MTDTTPAPAQVDIHPLDAALTTIVAAMDQWQAENDPATLTKRVHKLLDQNAEKLLLKLLGFDDKWGRWEIDHCNGRSGNSAAGDYLREVQQEAIQEWMKQVELPEFSETLKKRIKKQIAENYERVISENVWRLTKSKAEADIAALVNHVTSSNTYEMYRKTVALLKNEPVQQ